MCSDVYVRGYGVGSALDTGSAVRARRVDLGYDDDNLVLWNRWVDVYLLWPPPPDYQITWVLSLAYIAALMGVWLVGANCLAGVTLVVAIVTS